MRRIVCVRIKKKKTIWMEWRKKTLSIEQKRCQKKPNGLRYKYGKHDGAKIWIFE